MKRLAGSAIAALLLTAGCGGGSSSPSIDPTPTPSANAPSAAEAGAAFNDAITAALASGSGVTVSENRQHAILTGSIVADGMTFTFSSLELDKRPFAVNGTVGIVAGEHSVSIAFAGGTSGAYSEGGTAVAKIPMVNSFLQATAGWAMNQAWHPGFAAGACNVTVTDDGNGGILIDGTCTVCNVTVTITQLDIDPAGMTINGTIAIDDGNGNTATLTFVDTTVDVVVNGQDLGTFDLSQIF